MVRETGPEEVPCHLPRPGPWNPQGPSGGADTRPARASARPGPGRRGPGRSPRGWSAWTHHRGSRPEGDLRSAPGSSPAPTADPHGEACSCPSTPGPPGRRLGRPAHEPHPKAGPARTHGAGRSWPAWRPSVAGHAARHATARSRPCTRAATSASTRCGEAPERQSMGSDPTGERSPAHRDLALGRSRCLPARRMRDSGPTRSGTEKGSRRQRGETTETPPAMTRPPPQQRPRSSPPERSPPRT